MRLPMPAHASLVLAILLAAPALAGTTPPGLNLRWDQCYGDGGVANKNFACDTNTGSERLVGSFELAAELSNVNGVELRVDLSSASALLPDWWQYFNVGACRFQSLGMGFVPPPGSVNCVDWAAGFAQGGIANYTVGNFGPSTVTIRAVTAVPLDQARNLDPGQEYFAFLFTINHAKTVGTGACAGCATPVCIVFSSVRVAPSSGPVSLEILQGASTEASRDVTWQGGIIQSITMMHTQTGWSAVSTCVDASTPVRPFTWGAVKSLYR